MDQTREKLHCAVCGWEWWKRLGAPDPKRCARPSCRSQKWKGTPAAYEAERHVRMVHSMDIPISLDEAAESARPRPAAEMTPLEAMRPAAERIVKRIADELQAAEEEIQGKAGRELRYEPIEEC